MATITLKVKNPDGTPWAQQIEAHRFAHYIGNVRYWFAYHCPPHRIGGLQITHIDSGFKVCDVDYTTRAACLNNDKSAAKLALDNLIARVSAERVRSVLDNQTVKG
jgi:hypothetical protein